MGNAEASHGVPPNYFCTAEWLRCIDHRSRSNPSLLLLTEAHYATAGHTRSPRSQSRLSC